MIIDTNNGRLFLAVEHVEQRILERRIRTEWIIEALNSPDDVTTNSRGRDEYIKQLKTGKIKVVVADDESDQFDGLIVTVMKG